MTMYCLLRRCPAAADDALGGGFPSADHDCDANPLLDDQGRGPAHDQTRIGSDPGLRRIGSLHAPRTGRLQNRARCPGGASPAVGVRTGLAWHPCRHHQNGGVPESIDVSVAMRDEITAAIEQATLLKRAAQLSDVGNVAAFVASDQARTMTASTVNISCGALMDY